MGLWSATFESLGECQERAIERGLANLSQRLGVPVMDAIGRHVADARMPVLRVIPGEEGPAVGPRYLNWGRQPAGQLLLDQVRAAFSTMFDWALEGKLAPRTYRSFPLEEFAAALDLISSREVIGRVVFLPRAGQ